MIERVQAVSWWALAFSLIFVASNSEIFGISFVIVAAVSLTLAGRRNNSDSSGFYFRFALIVMATRVLFRIIFSYPSGQIELLSLPNLSLNLGPLGNVRFLGNLTLETLFAAVSDGARLAAIILAVGMANSIADVRDVIRSLPNALREIGLSISIALNLAPQLVISIRRVRQAQLLRGRSQSLKALAGFAVPVLEDAIDRSIMLAASMDSRGFGRSVHAPKRNRYVNRTLMFIALLAAAMAFAELLIVPEGAVVGFIFIAVAILSAAWIIRLDSRARGQSRFRTTKPATADYAIYAVSLIFIAANLMGVIS